MNLDQAIFEAVSSAVQTAAQQLVQNSERQALTVAQVAQEFGYPENLIRSAVRGGSLRHQRSGDSEKSTIYITRQWVREWQEATADGGTQ